MEQTNKPNSELVENILSTILKLSLVHPIGDHYDPISAAKDICKEFIKFTEFCGDRYTRVKGMWVNMDVGVLVHGSQYYYEKLAKDYGKTTEEVYIEFKQFK